MKRIVSCLFAIALLSCTTEIESPENILAQMPSSTSLSSLSSSSGLALQSSSSGGVSSSSVYVSSSSGVEVSSSGDDRGSSSSVEIGSSSSVNAPSSSNVAVSSSSSVVASSSSSSIAASSSSVVAGNVSCPNAVTGNNTVTCGEQDYSTVQIGTQTWMAENLNYEGPTGNRIGKCVGEFGSYGTLVDSGGHCGTYGRLYDWATAKTVCPSGWHLPSDEEWTTLTDYVESQGGCTGCDGTRLKTASANGYYYCSDYIAGTDNHGFSALLGGIGGGTSFSNVGLLGYWWSSTEGGDSYNVYSRGIGCNFSRVTRVFSSKVDLLSVRCLQD